jgi:hypothetical protein
MQPLNIEDPFFRIHNLGEMVADSQAPDRRPLAAFV